MARVDPDDDSIRRFVVHHHRYDPQRREFRNVAVAAFDNADEFDAALRETSAGIERRRRSGEPVDRREHASGTEYGPGAREQAAYGRFLQRAARHGVDVRRFLAKRDPPSNMAFIFFDSDDGDGQTDTGRGEDRGEDGG